MALNQQDRVTLRPTSLLSEDPLPWELRRELGHCDAVVTNVSRDRAMFIIESHLNVMITAVELVRIPLRS